MRRWRKSIVATLVRSVFEQPDAASVWDQHAWVLGQLEERFPQAAAILADAAPQPPRLHRLPHRALAPRLRVVDFQSRDVQALLRDLDGRQVVKLGKTYTLHTADATVERFDLSDFDQVLEAASDPNVAYLLLLLAMIGVAFWVTHPGFFLPGVVGVIAGILALLAFANLPVNLAGVLLILVAFVLFIVDLKAPTHGVLTTGGVVAMSLGAVLLIDTGFLAEGINLTLTLVTLLALAGTFAVVLRKVLAARRLRYATGNEAIIDLVGTVREPLEPDGLVFVDGALWSATSLSGSLERNAKVRVVGLDGLHLRVESCERAPSVDVDQPGRTAPP